MIKKKPSNPHHSNALVLCGGGARGAFQAGVIKAVDDILLRPEKTPFGIITGASAGAINCSFLASKAKNFHNACAQMETVWKNIEFNKVFCTNDLELLARGLKWQAALLPFSFLKFKLPLALLNNEPLKKTIEELIDFSEISENIESELLKAVCITCSSYSGSMSTTFFESSATTEGWMRHGRNGVRTFIDQRHLMASSAIPFVFPAQDIDGKWYTDGSLRQVSPISPAIYHGARKALIISCNSLNNKNSNTNEDAPALADMAGHILHGLFNDHLPMDIERMQNLNDLIDSNKLFAFQKKIKKIDFVHIFPSIDVDQLVSQHLNRLPSTLSKLFSRAGVSKSKGSNLVSYIMFDKEFCSSLFEHGYDMAWQQKEKIQDLLQN